jgi:hydantoinase/carbamoylase family amidase
MRVDERLLSGILEGVNSFGGLDNGGAERLAWSDQEVAARRWLLETCLDRGFEAEMDEAGNVWAFIGRRPAVVLGSHLDTVPNGGRFDGALGIAAALAGLIAARDAGADGLGLVCFTDEEGVRFGLGMTGSRALAGSLSTAEVNSCADRAGIRLADAMATAGARPEAVARVADRRDDVAAFMELHVEQGMRLERAQLPAGIVTAIAGISHWQIEVAGEANHAGTTLPEDRRDALLPVAAAALRADAVMRAAGGLVATVGEAAVVGGAQNVVPGKAAMSLDVRSEDDAAIDGAVGEVLTGLRARAEAHGCEVDARESKRLRPAPMHDEVIGALRAGARELGLDAPGMPSMAGHDAMNLARAGIPCGMVFVRSRGGISHSPREHSDPSDCATGASLLLAAALDLAGRG